MIDDRLKLKNKINKVSMVIMDVDGVLTDGRIVYSSKDELKFFDVQDGYGLYLLNKFNINTAIITARKSKIVKRRAKDMHISSVYYTHDKLWAYEKIKDKFNLKDENICYIGDDLLDLPVIKKVGFSVTVPNAFDDIKKEVDYISTKRGGRGAVREIADLILKAKGLRDDVINI